MLNALSVYGEQGKAIKRFMRLRRAGKTFKLFISPEGRGKALNAGCPVIVFDRFIWSPMTFKRFMRLCVG